MQHFQYSFVLIFVALCAIFVNTFFKLRISSQLKTFLKVDAVVLAIYLTWDAWAIHKRNWSFDPDQISKISLPGGIPLEEVAFFVIVPLMTILTYLALFKIVSRFKRGATS